MRTTTSGRRPSLFAAPLALLCALTLAACADDDTGDTGGDGGDGGGAVGATLSDLEWDVDDAIADFDPCGTHVVASDLGERLQVVDVTTEEVLHPEVTPPEGSDLRPDDDWLTSGGCVPTADGPVVVVEAQEPYVDLDDAPPKLFAGFTPDGEQLWARELPGDHLGGYGGHGSFVVDQVGPKVRAWLVLDARTGEIVAEGRGEEGQPSLVVGRDLAVTDAGVVRLPGGGAHLPDPGIAQVDGQRLLAYSSTGLALVGLADGKRVWVRDDVELLAVWSESADLSTGVVVALDEQKAIVGLDLATGETKWTSSVGNDAVNASAGIQVGSGVVTLPTSGDLDQQVVLDSATGEVLEPDGTLVAGQEVLLLVGEDGPPRKVTVDDLR